MDKPSVFVCSGKSCSGTKAWRKLCDSLDSHAHVNEVGCQKICDGPVCGVIVRGHLEWFEDLSRKAIRSDIEGVLSAREEPSQRLLKRIVPNRRDKLR